MQYAVTLMRKWGRTLVVAWLILVLGVHSVWAAPALEEKLGPARMNWQTRVLIARGEAEFGLGNEANDQTSRQTQIRQARLRTRRSLWQGLLRVRVDNDLRVEDIIQDNPDQAKALREHVHTSHIRQVSGPKAKEISDFTDQVKRTLTYEARFHLTGQRAALCIPSSVWYEEQELSAPEVNATVEETDASYTGLVVDARGLGGKAALICRLFDEQGHLVYGPSLVSRQIGEEKGMVGYASSLQRARSSSRAGDAPLVVRARSRHSDSRTEFVVPASEVHSAWPAGTGEVFRQGKVIILLQEEDGDQVVEYPLDQS